MVSARDSVSCRVGPAARGAAAALLAALVMTAGPANAEVPASDGTLVIAKQVTAGSGPDAGIFTFRGSWGESFLLSAGEQRSTGLPPGTYTVTESPEPGYDSLGASCSGPAGVETFAAPTATASLAAGRSTTCTFTSQPIIDISVEPDVTANARLRARRSCSGRRRLVASVASGNASWVSFSLNGRWVGTARRPSRGRTYRVTTPTPRGKLSLSARVRFSPGSSPPEVRLTRGLAACPSDPAFAGSRR